MNNMNQERNPPEVWARLGGFMHQDYNVCYPEFWLGIEEFCRSVSSSERKELIEFLRYLNRSDLPGGMHKRYWLMSGAQIMPPKIKPFFKDLLVRIDGLQNE